MEEVRFCTFAWFVTRRGAAAAWSGDILPFSPVPCPPLWRRSFLGTGSRARASHDPRAHTPQGHLNKFIHALALAAPRPWLLIRLAHPAALLRLFRSSHTETAERI